MRRAGVSYGRSQLAVFRLRRQAVALADEHSRVVYRLGLAVYRDDVAEADAAKGRLATLDEQIAATEQEIDVVHRRMSERIETSRKEDGQTVALEPPADRARAGTGSAASR